MVSVDPGSNHQEDSVAKGKQAALSARRQHAAAMEHLSAVTDELAELKVRTRDAEARAFHAEQRARNAELQVQKDAEVVANCVALIDAQRKAVRKQDAEWNDGPKTDLLQMFDDLRSAGNMGRSDIMDFLMKRYPRFTAYLGWGESQGLYRRPHMRGLTEEHVRKLGRALGERVTISWDPERDAADVVKDILDIKHMNLTQDEMLELLDVDKADK
jgi:hypothetical protein